MDRKTFYSFVVIALAALLPSHGSRAQGTAAFESFFGGPWSDGGNALVSLSDGGFAIGGWKTREGQPHLRDGWIIRVDNRGRHLWDLPISDTAENGILALSASLDGGLLAVARSNLRPESDARLIKISGQGQIEFSKPYGGPGPDRINALRPTFDGGVIMAGSTTDERSGATDAWIVKLDAAFDVQWFRTFGEPAEDAAEDIAVTPNGDYLAVGKRSQPGSQSVGWAVQVDALGSVLWENTYALGNTTRLDRVITVNGTRSIAAASVSNSEGVGRVETALLAFNERGELEWQRRVSAAGSILVHDLAQRTDGTLLAAGTVDDDTGQDGIVLRFSADGAIGDFTRYNGNRLNGIRSITAVPGASFAFAGVTLDQASGNEDVWLLIGRPMMQVRPNQE